MEGQEGYVFIVLDNIETLVGLSICPLFFLYMRTVAHDAHWHKWYWGLFAPGILICGTGTILSIALGWDGVMKARSGNFSAIPPDSDNLLEKAYELVNIHLFNITLEVMAVVLIGLSIFYLATYYKHIRDYYANIEESSALRMNYFLFCSILLLLSIFLITLFIRDIAGSNISILLCISLLFSVLSWCIYYNAYKIVLTDKMVDFISLENNEAEDVQENNEEGSIKMDPIDEMIRQKVSSWQNPQDKRFCKEGLTVAEVAKDIQINPRVLSIYINKYKGMNFNRWINTLRIEEAKNLFLSSPEIKIGYVAVVCGFADQASFSKVFRKVEGCTPGEFLSQQKEQ